MGARAESVTGVMRCLVTAASLLITACTPHYDLIRTEAFIHYKIVDERSPPQKPSGVGVTRCSDQGICEIQILRDYYPECLEHEDRHVFEGNWHGDVPTNCR